MKFSSAIALSFVSVPFMCPTSVAAAPVNHAAVRGLPSLLMDTVQSLPVLGPTLGSILGALGLQTTAAGAQSFGGQQLSPEQVAAVNSGIMQLSSVLAHAALPTGAVPGVIPANATSAIPFALPTAPVPLPSAGVPAAPALPVSALSAPVPAMGVNAPPAPVSPPNASPPALPVSPLARPITPAATPSHLPIGQGNAARL